MRVTLLSICLSLCLTETAAAQNWPSFRGRNASGVQEGASVPTVWDAEKSVNLAWKTPLPGLGHSSPVVWEDRVFITTAITSSDRVDFTHGPTQSVASAKDVSKHTWALYCVNKLTGRIMWNRTAIEGVPRVKRHVKASHANSTPATDGRYVVALFGSEGLYCYDLNGKLLWKQDLGILDGGWSPDPSSHWGFGSSPIIYRHLVIVQCDSQKDSFIAAYNLKDGKRAWLTPRDEDTSWSSPSIYEGKIGDELIASGTKYYRGYDPLTGKELWRLADGSDVKIPTPVSADGLVFVGGGSSHAKRAFYAIRGGSRGEVTPAGAATNSGVAWQNRAVPHVLTPIVYGGFLYVSTDNGVLTQYNAKTGEMTYRERIGGRGSAFSASPVAADGKLFFTSEDGEVFVVRAGAEYELLSTNAMGEVVMATPAISNGLLIIRGQHHLFGIREDKPR